MFGIFSSVVKQARPGRVFCCALVFLALAGGCHSPPLPDLRGDSFPEDDLGRLSGQLRRPDPDFEPLTWSNKAREIERNLSGDINQRF